MKIFLRTSLFIFKKMSLFSKTLTLVFLILGLVNLFIFQNILFALFAFTLLSGNMAMAGMVFMIDTQDKIIRQLVEAKHKRGRPKKK